MAYLILICIVFSPTKSHFQNYFSNVCIRLHLLVSFPNLLEKKDTMGKFEQNLGELWLLNFSRETSIGKTESRTGLRLPSEKPARQSLQPMKII